MLRVNSSWLYDCVKPERNVKTANQRIVSCRTLARPMRSARMPAIHPPSDETSSAAVASVPPWACDRLHTAISVGITTA